MVAELSTEQKEAIDVILSGRNVVLLGSAGTGKSHVIRHVVKELDVRKVVYRVTAPTGIAANNIGGTTLHQVVCMGLAQEHKEVLLLKTRKNRRLVNFWKSCAVLIIDEVSMLDTDFASKVDYIACSIRNQSHLPFGGIQIILCGDFYQLPPVQRGEDGSLFLFESDLWQRLNLKVIQLKTIHRQSDKEFIEVLSRIRTGDMVPSDYDYLEQLKRPLDLPDGVVATELMSTNKEVDATNAIFFHRLDTQVHEYTAIVGHHDDAESMLPTMPGDLIATLKKSILSNNPVGEHVQLRVGAQVMLCFNMKLHSRNPPPGGMVTPFFNGSKGIIVDILHDVPVVRFNTHSAGEDYFVPVNEWTTRLSDYRTIISMTQIPLRLAWSCTIHRVQGLTLSPLHVNIGSTIFVSGQAYVALSRAVGPDTLRVFSFCKNKKIEANPKVKQFYSSLER